MRRSSDWLAEKWKGLCEGTGLILSFGLWDSARLHSELGIKQVSPIVKQTAITYSKDNCLCEYRAKKKEKKRRERWENKPGKRELAKHVFWRDILCNGHISSSATEIVTLKTQAVWWDFLEPTSLQIHSKCCIKLCKTCTGGPKSERKPEGKLY